MGTEFKGLILTVTLPAEHKRFTSTLILKASSTYMYILLVNPATYKHYVRGIESSHTQKRYNLNLSYEDT